MILKDALDINGESSLGGALEVFSVALIVPRSPLGLLWKFQESQRDQMIVELVSWSVDQVSELQYEDMSQCSSFILNPSAFSARVC